MIPGFRLEMPVVTLVVDKLSPTLRGSTEGFLPVYTGRPHVKRLISAVPTVAHTSGDMSTIRCALTPSGNHKPVSQAVRDAVGKV
jgi:hypothetical protein